MNTIENVVESSTTIVLDGKYFVNCKYTKCTVIYMGGDFGCIDSNFTDCKVILQGAADRTANILKLFGWAPPGPREAALAPKAN